MPDQTQREQILAIVQARLQQITTANEFSTDAGATIVLGEVPQLGPDDPAVALAIVVGDDEVIEQIENIRIDLPIQIAMVVRVRADDPVPAWTMVERGLGDIKRAMEIAGRRIDETDTRSPRLRRGQTRTLERADGSSIVGAAVTYVLETVETWGFP